MTAIRSKETLPSFPRAKISRIVKRVLPKGKPFQLRTADSGIRQKKIVRIVTPAWKNLRLPDRIFKLLAAVDAELSEAEQDRILRFSVLTPEEYRKLITNGHAPDRTFAGRRTAAKNLAVKRPPVLARKKRALPR
jgi:hypothetical protein